MSQIASGVLGIVAGQKKKEIQLKALSAADQLLIERLQQSESDQRRFDDIFFASTAREASDLDRIRDRNIRSTQDITAARAREVIELNNANAAATGNIRSGALLEANARTFSDIFNTVEQEKLATDFGLSAAEQGLRAGATARGQSLNDLLFRGSLARADIRLGRGAARAGAVDSLAKGGADIAGGILSSQGSFGGGGGQTGFNSGNLNDFTGADGRGRGIF